MSDTAAPSNSSCRSHASSITAMIAHVPATWADEVKRAWSISMGLAYAIHYRHIDRLSLSEEARWTLRELQAVINFMTENSKSPWCAHEAMHLAIQSARTDRPAGTPLAPFSPKRACCQEMGGWVDLADGSDLLQPEPTLPALPSYVPKIPGSVIMAAVRHVLTSTPSAVVVAYRGDMPAERAYSTHVIEFSRGMWHNSGGGHYDFTYDQALTDMNSR